MFCCGHLFMTMDCLGLRKFMLSRLGVRCCLIGYFDKFVQCFKGGVRTPHRFSAAFIPFSQYSCSPSDFACGTQTFARFLHLQ